MQGGGGMGAPMMGSNQSMQQRMQMQQQQMSQMNQGMPQRMMRPGVNVQQGGLRQVSSIQSQWSGGRS